MSGRCPTEKQYVILRSLGGGAAGLSRTKRDTEPLLRRGWVTAKWKSPFYQWVVITPEGLRALALAVERFGWPEFANPSVTVKICAGCEREWSGVCRHCGDRSYRFNHKAVAA